MTKNKETLKDTSAELTALFQELYAKYNLPPETMARLNASLREVYVMEHGEEVAAHFFDIPVNEDGEPDVSNESN